MQVTIVSKTNLSNYCSKWGYKWQSNKDNLNGWVLFMNDKVTDINNTDLSFILSIVPKAKRIDFIGLTSYFEHYPVVNNFKSLQYAPITKISYGYPIINGNQIILHRSYLTNIFNSTKILFDIPHILNNVSVKIKSKSAIPKVIYQTFQTHAVPSSFKEAVDDLIKKNPDYEYRYYDDLDCRDFIETYFSDILDIYDILIPGAYKSDLWRLCVIYQFGGVYLDIKHGTYDTLSNIISDSTELLLVDDNNSTTRANKNRIHTSFLAAKPKCKAIYEAIKLVLSRIENRDYGNSALYATGPDAVGTAIYKHYDWKLKPSPLNNTLILKYEKTKDGYDFILNTKKCIQSRFPSKDISNNIIIQNITGMPHYSELWTKRLIFN